jgi:hypothetical protein
MSNKLATTNEPGGDELRKLLMRQLRLNKLYFWIASGVLVLLLIISVMVFLYISSSFHQDGQNKFISMIAVVFGIAVMAVGVRTLQAYKTRQTLRQIEQMLNVDKDLLERLHKEITSRIIEKAL